MKKLLYLLLALATVCACQSGYRMKNGEGFNLATPWVLSHDSGEESVQATVPCTVAGALEEAGLLGENLLDGNNYAKADRTPFDDP